MPSTLGLAMHLRGVLRIDQHDVGAGRLQARQAFVQEGGVRQHRLIPQHRIGPDLPEHEVGLLGDHGGVEARQHVGGFVAVHAAVQHRDLVPGEAPVRARPPAGSDTTPPRCWRRRRRSTTTPSATILTGLAGGDEPRHPAQRQIEARLLGGNGAGRRSRRGRRLWQRDRHARPIRAPAPAPAPAQQDNRPQQRRRRPRGATRCGNA